ncbi:MAG: hypothetical protein OEZ06_01190 [Myxococcales bacterium]|nr:hypothetical protein [Myxococcales bacterium]
MTHTVGASDGVRSAYPEHTKRVACRLRAGQGDVHGGSFTPLAPLGGHRQSGSGRQGGALG